MTLEATAITPFDISVGDATGFIALILVGVSAMFMLIRSKLLKVTRNIAAVRGVHVAVSSLAGVFMIVHIALLFTPPITVAIDLGYASVAVSVAVWLTGTAFLERLRDSLFFHGTLSTILAGLIMVHAATATLDIPLLLSETMLALTVVIMVVNAAYHIRRVVGRPPTPRPPPPRPAAPEVRHP